MNKSILIKLLLSFLFVTKIFSVESQSSFKWSYLDVTTIEEPLENLYNNLEFRHHNSARNCASSEKFPTSFQILESANNEYEIYHFSGNDELDMQSEMHIKNVKNGDAVCFSQEDLGLQSIGDVGIINSSGKILLADFASNKIVFITPLGEIESYVDVPFDFVHVKYVDDKYFFHSLDTEKNNSADIIRVCSSQLDVLKEYRFPSSNRVMRGFNKLGTLQSDENSVFFNPTYDTNIYEINEVERNVIFSLKDFVVTDNFKKDPFMSFFVRNNILYFTQTLFNSYYSFIVDLENKEVFVVHNSVPILAKKPEFEYYYVFSPVNYSIPVGFITHVSGRNAKNDHGLEGHHADHIDLSGAVSNIKKMGFCDNAHNFMLYEYNFEFLRRNASKGLKSVFPEADLERLNCKELDFETAYNPGNNTIAIEINSNKDMEIEIGLFSLLERASLDKIKVQANIKNYYTVDVPLQQKGIGFVHLRTSDGCRSTKQVFIY